MLFEVSAWYSGVWFVAVWRGFVVSVSSEGAVMDRVADLLAIEQRLTDHIVQLAAERDAAVKALAESRARFGDSEARRAELEAVIEKVRERLVTLQTNSIRGGWASRAAESILRDCLSTTRSVVPEDRDREVAARAVEAAGAEYGTPGMSATSTYVQEWLRERAAAIRKGDPTA